MLWWIAFDNFLCIVFLTSVGQLHLIAEKKSEILTSRGDIVCLWGRSYYLTICNTVVYLIVGLFIFIYSQ